MDTGIFEYLKTKRAVFEIRHYIIERKKANEDPRFDLLKSK